MEQESKFLPEGLMIVTGEFFDCEFEDRNDFKTFIENHTQLHLLYEYVQKLKDNDLLSLRKEEDK